MSSPLSNDEIQAFFTRANFLGGALEKTRQLYADWAPVYEATLERFGRYLSPDRIADLAWQNRPDPEARILDVACGTGWIGKALWQRGYRRMTGLDLSPAMLAEAEAKGCYERLIATPIADFDPDPGFDLVVSAGLLTMGHQGFAAFELMLAALAPGGVIVVDVEAGTFRDHGFAPRLDCLVAEGRLALVTLQDGHFYESAADEPPHGSFLAAWRPSTRPTSTDDL